jgi:hypothetical protein
VVLIEERECVGEREYGEKRAICLEKEGEIDIYIDQKREKRVLKESSAFPFDLSHPLPIALLPT